MTKYYGVNVKAYKISKEQVKYARQRAEEEGLNEQIEYILDDYRNIRGCTGDYSNEKLQAYNDLMEQRFGKRLPEPELMESLPMFVKRIFASQLMKTHWFTKNVVTDKWFLQSHQTPMPAIKE